MDTLLPSNSLLFLPSLFFFILLTTTRAEACSPRYCGNSIFPIQFPFQLRGDNQSQSCGYQGFEVSCDGEVKKQTLINLTNAGKFVLTSISYLDHKLWINDPHDCLAKHYLHHPTLDLAGSSFQLSDDLKLVNVTFLKCNPLDLLRFNPIQPIKCLSNDTTSVVAMTSDSEFFEAQSPMPTPNFSRCQKISSAMVQFDEFDYLYWTGDFFSDIQLQWSKPNCDYPNCEEDSKKGINVVGLVLGVSAGTLFFVMMISCLIYTAKTRLNQEQVEEENIELNNIQQQFSTAAVMAVNEVNMERYPKSQVEDNGELPNPNDIVCSICLCEYQPKETLRRIPDCNHYFHAHCLEGWLKINASCPLCRNLPKCSFPLSSSTSQSSSSS